MEKQSSSLSQIRVIYTITTLVLVALSTYSFIQIRNLIDASDLVNHTNEVTLTLQKISNAIADAESNKRAYLLSKDSTLLKKRNESLHTIAIKRHLLDSLIKDNPEQVENLKILNAVIEQKIISINNLLYQNRPLERNTTLKTNINEGVVLTEKVKRIINIMTNVESELLSVRTQKYYHLSFLSPIFIVILFLTALLILLISYARINKLLLISHETQIKFEELNTQLQIQNEELEKSEERFLKMFDNNPIAMTFGELGSNKIIYANNLFYRSFGYNKDEVIGHTSEELQLVSKEENERLIPIILSYLDEGTTVAQLQALPAEEIAKVLIKLRQEMFQNGYEVEYTRKNGQIFYAMVYFEIIEIGNKSYALTSYQDVTEMKESSRQLEKQNKRLEKINEQILEQKDFNGLIINSSLDLIAVFDKELRYTSLNSAAYQLYNKSPDEIIGKKIIDVFPQIKESGMYADLEQALQGETVRHPNYRSLSLQGDLYFENNFIPLRNTHNEVYGVLVIGHDITDRIHAERKLKSINEELEQTNEELKQSNKELESFNYISSHDLQEPLRKIQTLTGFLLEKENKNLSDTGKNYFSKIRSSAARMQQLIQDLLEYSRINLSERKFEKSDLNDILEEVKEDFKDELLQKQGVIKSNGMCTCNIIPFQIRQLLYNLIGNSIKFARPETAPIITVESNIAKGSKLNNQKLLPEQDYCHIMVADNGIGFESAYNDRIFELFQRLNGKEEYLGTGIGLSIAKKIVENHGGIITATSQINNGAQFDIYIPAT